jgi:hypothetical protein
MSDKHRPNLMDALRVSLRDEMLRDAGPSLASTKTQRRREREAQHDAEQAVIDTERRRKESLDLWSRIEESGASDNVKDILHRLANGERES